MDVSTAHIDVRITIDTQAVPLWRVRVVHRIARLLGVPLHIDENGARSSVGRAADFDSAGRRFDPGRALPEPACSLDNRGANV